ncbi:TetR family transcriptional regulator [Coprobacillaceae bacterium CR2/5/TPMF4]|nr:TetR family transcriptional regulator [Coprobacillaceae bacterium CR2/5/TPMF4]
MKGFEMMNRTELVIAKAFWQLLEEKPYSKITVKNIVERCEINRNTFYYHFHDIPDLLDRILKRNANDIINKSNHFDNLIDFFIPIVEDCNKRKKQF